jgi:excinuclease ABC subunit A
MAHRPPPDRFVRVRNARVHNLRHVDVDIPRDAIVAFTGVSGSGKSSLAFATIHAEAQRRYLESVAPYARRLLHPPADPEVDEISGLPPAVALQQRRVNTTSRSSVGTLTTIGNFVRLLYSRAGDYPPGAEPLPAEAFSRNTPAGACPACHGLGRSRDVTESSMVPDRSRSIRDGAIAAWPGGWQGRNLRDIVRALGIDVDIPWKHLRKRDRDWLLFTDEQPVVLVDPEPDRDEWPYNGTFVSARRHVMTTAATSKSERMRERALGFMEPAECPVCGGTGLRPEALAVTFAGHDIATLGSMPLTALVASLRPHAEPRDAAGAASVASTLAAEVVARADVLIELGLGYLSLRRPTTTLSPGELQRLRIATELRSGLFGVVYVLDEPSAGLHPADAAPLAIVIERLRDAGNSVFLVEHDMELVRGADWIVDVGPGPGTFGGTVLYSGPVRGLGAVPSSITARYLDRRRRAPAGRHRTPTRWVELSGVRLNNLHDLDAAVPLAVMTVVTGVSGSGKTSLVRALASVVAQSPSSTTDDEDAASPAIAISKVEGADEIDRQVTVDQRPIGRTPRSSLATYTGLFDDVRKAFAQTLEAQARGYRPGRFSFNVAGGRCETCQGEGFVCVELVFLPTTYSPCPVCKGGRFNPETLEVRYRGHDIAQVLALTVDEASDLFADLGPVARSLTTLRDVGLGYLRLGQPATELSGGEAQRIKLATELQRAPRGHTLYVLDEPTTGLHPADVELLIELLQRLVDAGNSVVVVEHDLDVVAAADWIIDLGPGGGHEGGRIVATGPPAEVAANPASVTGRYLARRRSSSR